MRRHCAKERIPLWAPGDLNQTLTVLGVLPAAQLPRFNKGGTIRAPGIAVTAVRAEHSSIYVWRNPSTDREEAHYGANPLGTGTPEEYMKALGDTSAKVFPLKPGEKVEF
jgi:hypothetical protein